MNLDTGDRHPLIGAAGVGRMGAPIIATLGRTFPVSAYDIDEKREGVVPGVRWARSISDLAGAVDVFVTILPGPGELRRAMSDAFPSLRPGTLWVDLTSGDPAVTSELGVDAVRRGIDLVSAPMGGSVAEAVSGDLVFFVSGSDAAVARALPILQTVSRIDGLRRTGSRPEDAQIVKLLTNGLWFANAVAASEAVLIGQGLGLSPADLHGLLRDGAGGSRFLDHYFARLLDGDYLETFGIDRVVEELDAIGTMGATAGVSTPMLDASARLHREALERFGPALGELLAVKLLEQSAGRWLRR